jgi:hypothetical protein
MDKFCAKSTTLRYNTSSLFGWIRITFHSRKMPGPRRIHNLWLYSSLVNSLNIPNIRPTTTIWHKEKSTYHEGPGNATSILQIPGEFEMQWFNNQAAVPMCVANQQAPHAINVIWNGSQSARPLWRGQYEIRNEDLQEILWRCNPWTIEVHGYWRPQTIVLGPNIHIHGNANDQPAAVSICAR